MANQTEIKSRYNISNVSIPGNKFSEVCWDNVDLYEETPFGLGTKHTTQGILIQEIQMIFAKKKVELPLKLSATYRDTQIQISDVESREDKIYKTISL